MYTLKIKVTREILEKSSMCGYTESSAGDHKISTNCALALAVREIFPNAWVGKDFICTDSFLFSKLLQESREGGRTLLIALQGNPSKFIYNTRSMTKFVIKFDSTIPEERKLLGEQEFDLPIPDEVVDDIDIEEVKKVLQNSSVLKLEEV